MGFPSGLTALAQAMREASDTINADKIEELRRKREAGEVVFAFCGHFSAGKSSLVNRLCGHPLLPSGPIPTSANAVKIRNGEPGARIVRKDGTVEQVTIGRLGEACRDGTAERVDIRWPMPFLGEQAALLDTPGIDSTDEAHKLATESALHVADVVFYVMDYHYVQSELNFAFAKRLKEWGKPLYLLVNQIDKHKERELPFAQFQEGVKEAFSRWHIEPAGILFLSLKETAHPHNEYGKLRRLLRELSARGEELRNWTLERSALQLIKEHMKEVRASHELEKFLYREAAGDEAAAGTEPLERHKAQLQERLHELQALPERLAAEWKKELASTIGNANLIPAATRELALRYLESRRPGFKAGWFASAARTAEETVRRLEAFHAALLENVTAGLIWHVRGYLQRQAEERGIADRELAEAVAAYAPELSPEWLARQVNPGAEASGEYALNFAKRLSEELKQDARRQAYALLERMTERLRAEAAGEADAVRAKLEALAVRLAAAKGLARLEQEEQAHERRLLALAAGGGGQSGRRPDLPDPSAWPAEAAAAADAPPQPAGSAGQERSDAAGAGQGPPGAEPAVAANAAASTGDRAAMAQRAAAAPAPPSYRAKLAGAAAMLRDAAALLADVPWLSPSVRAMGERAAKLAGNRFTIALFGAFSAGKSSFANALFGERLLPVSPNPATASITTVLAPTPEFPNGTVVVSMKERGALMEEIAGSLQALGFAAAGEGEEEILRAVSRLRPEQAGPAGKPHLTFLKAVEKGWEAAQEHLGRELRVGLERLAEYAADETKSCFVRSVELYYATPLTERGVVLVDTPGADSINARHTGVAFNYIKNADAILFVTYYNHAFSLADREFLLQLGRVKDSFELDKMFFVVNAADLAANAEELDGVLRHVGENLLRHGIRNPRLYPVSSLKAIEAKQEGGSAARLEASGIVRFEREFRRFALDELADMAVHGARKEVERAAAQLDRWLEAAARGQAERARTLERLEQACRSAERALAEPPASDVRGELAKEIGELLYYAKQRVMFRFGEFYQHAFHPSVLQDDGRDIRTALSGAWRELVRMLSRALAQEVLATTLRAEQFLKRRMAKHWDDCTERIRRFVPDYEPPSFAPPMFLTPALGEAISAAEPEERALFGFYRSGRHFFEGEGKERLRRVLEAELSGPTGQYVEEHREKLLAAYAAQQEEALRGVRLRHAAALSDHCAGLRAVMAVTADAELLSHKKMELEQLLYATVGLASE